MSHQDDLSRPSDPMRERRLVTLAGLAWGIAAAVTLGLPDAGDWIETGRLGIGLAAVGVALFALGLVGGRLTRGRAALLEAAPWLIALGLGLALWQLAAAKLGWLPQPFFPPPQALLEAYAYDWPVLAQSFYASGKLLATGYAIGAILGFALGVSLGVSRQVGYWVHPVLRFLGPLPATALLPVVFVTFPSSWSASIFLIALAAGFPVTVLTWSGAASVSPAYYDVARTLGARPAFLIFRVAIPAAMPSVFVGLFMALGAAFTVLMVAELVGVNAGVGFYIQWQQGWAAYGSVYAALVLLALTCSGAITLLFAARDRLLSWQKGLVKW
jgi:NitT/TauT family transport system permease protein